MFELLMPAADIVVPPPQVNLFPYPVAMSTGGAILATLALLVISSKFDPSHGALTISLIIVLTFCGTVTFCLFFTVPSDTTTSAIIGGLVAALGATVSYWLKPKDPPH
jgi:hypothetical protein